VSKVSKLTTTNICHNDLEAEIKIPHFSGQASIRIIRLHSKSKIGNARNDGFDTFTL
jgi:hypothetical protein